MLGGVRYRYPFPLKAETLAQENPRQNRKLEIIGEETHGWVGWQVKEQEGSGHERNKGRLQNFCGTDRICRSSHAHTVVLAGEAAQEHKVINFFAFLRLPTYALFTFILYSVCLINHRCKLFNQPKIIFPWKRLHTHMQGDDMGETDMFAGSQFHIICMTNPIFWEGERSLPRETHDTCIIYF